MEESRIIAWNDGIVALAVLTKDEKGRITGYNTSFNFEGETYKELHDRVLDLRVAFNSPILRYEDVVKEMDEVLDEQL